MESNASPARAPYTQAPCTHVERKPNPHYIEQTPGAGATFAALHVEETVLTELAGAGTPLPENAEQLGGEDLLRIVLSSLEDDKAEDVVQVDLHGKSDIADYMVIASGRSSRQVSAIAEKLVDRLKTDARTLCRAEGKDAGDWVLIDAGDVVVHIFRPEVRDFYQLEKMWLSTPDAARRAADAAPAAYA